MEATSNDLRIRSARREIEQTLNHYGLGWDDVSSGWYRDRSSVSERDQAWNTIRGLWKNV